ncbi:hypothetical protein JTE90_020184 [Oedothorax gibbosus]|uniref:Uncharacterized protein n=1 Tax=Oedothorax gibbosus TaxID=931172 RepID=A0AAV6U1Q3_9ARAC|nr:hypothetical protein JTE90_020184 [Oedothorax gibbosus]
MKLSVTTFRAGAQRLTTLWANQAKPPSNGPSRLSIPSSIEADDEYLLPRRVNSLDSLETPEKIPRTPRSITTLGLSQVRIVI